MLLMKVETASIRWKPEKRRWSVTLAVGEEVIKRSPVRPLPHDATDDALRACVVAIAQDEGYEVLPKDVSVVRG